jgi:hypothetical protein
MLETLLYLTATVLTIIVLVEITPSGTSPIALIFAAIAFVAVLAAARHGPAALVAVLEALSRLIGR